MQGWFERFDVIVTPTLTRTAIPIEERLFEPIEIEGRKTDTVRKAWYPYTHPFNLTGHPAITLPCGFHSDGLPMAIQLVGRRGEDARLFRHRGAVRAGPAVGGQAAGDRGGRRLTDALPFLHQPDADLLPAAATLLGSS